MTLTPPSPAPNAVRVPLRTVKRPVEWTGIGMHSGASSWVRVLPQEQPGLYFVAGGTDIPAIADYVSETTRCTVLQKDGVSVATVEHLLAALTGLGIWSARIETNPGEMPILDGSAGPFVEGLRDAGLDILGDLEAFVPEAGEIREGDALRSWSPAEERAAFSFYLAGDHPLLSGQAARHNPDDSDGFAAGIAPCRTWSPIEQVQPLLDRGLIRGGSLENALVVYPDRYSSELRLECEPARHKLLDLMGDLALVGRPVHARIDATGGGHTLNVQLAKALREQAAEKQWL